MNEEKARGKDAQGKAATMNVMSNVARSITASDIGIMVAGGIMAKAHAGSMWGLYLFGPAASEDNKGAGCHLATLSSELKILAQFSLQLNSPPRDRPTQQSQSGGNQ